VENEEPCSKHQYAVMNIISRLMVMTEYKSRHSTMLLFFCKPFLNFFYLFNVPLFLVTKILEYSLHVCTCALAVISHICSEKGQMFFNNDTKIFTLWLM